MSFIRARRDDQKAERVEAILTTARQLCQEKGVLDWSLNELGKRANFTKSNIYRYFGSREEILMTLLHQEIATFAKALSATTDNKTLSVNDFSSVMATLFSSQTFLCDLLCVSSTVLEQNVNDDAIWKIKQAGFEYERMVVEAIESSIVDMNNDMAQRVAFGAGVIVAGLWPLTRPSAPIRRLMLDNGNAKYDLDFCTELQKSLAALSMGIIQQELHRTN